MKRDSSGEVTGIGWDHTRVKNFILENDFDAYHKMVLVVLSYFADRSGRSFPSVEKASEIAGMSTRTFNRACGVLVSYGYLDIKKRTGHSNLYTILTPVTQSPHPRHTVTPTPVTQSPITRPIELDQVTSKTPPISDRREFVKFWKNQAKNPDLQYPQEFKTLWTVYPRPAGKRAGFLAFLTQLSKHSYEDLLFCTKAYAEEQKLTDTKFIKHMATFFGPKDYWEDYLHNDAQERPKCPNCGRVKSGTEGFCYTCGHDFEEDK